MNDAIVVKNLGKQYQIHHKNKPQTIMEAVISGFKDFKPPEKFWALQDVSFSIKFGEMFGVMGKNGSGKSTLLRLIGKVGKPERGKIETYGQIRGLLDLGAGFHDDLTGRENIFIGGVVVGLTKKEIRQRFDDIVDFAELAEFIDNPVRTYSSGMRMRLAFSVAIHTNPEILLIDEQISVGDTKFKQKCQDRILQLKNNGCAIMFVSQSPQQIQQLCDRALWLNQGIVMASGEAQEVSMKYLAYVHNQNKGQDESTNQPNFPKIKILDVSLSPANEIETGSPLRVQVTYQLQEILDNFIIRITITNDEGQICCAIARGRKSFNSTISQEKESITANFARLDLSQGQYFVNVFLVEPETNYIYDNHCNIYSLNIRSNQRTNGIICPPYSWELNN